MKLTSILRGEVSPQAQAMPLHGQNLDIRQANAAAARDGVRPAPATNADTVKTPPKQVAGLMSIPVPASSPAPATATEAPVLRLASGKPVINEYEAYWASQPPEVQALMNLPTEAEKMTLAHELADKGFTIDVPIMIWNWDPLATMVVRQNQGFTWVPSANQEPVHVMPGLTFPGGVSYDPKNPPPGSIRVSTDWAKGFERTCPWLKYDDAGNIISL